MIKVLYHYNRIKATNNTVLVYIKIYFCGILIWQRHDNETLVLPKAEQTKVSGFAKGTVEVSETTGFKK